jgi:hypothetical protein
VLRNKVVDKRVDRGPRVPLNYVGRAAVPLVKLTRVFVRDGAPFLELPEVDPLRVAIVAAPTALQKPAHGVGGHIAVLRPEVQEQPELEARVRHPASNAVAVRTAGRVRQPWMGPWRLDVKHTPDLVIGFVTILSSVRRASLVLDGLLHQPVRFAGMAPELDPGAGSSSRRCSESATESS